MDLADTQAREENYFNRLTGFNSSTEFQGVLKFVLPGGERKNIVYWNTKASKNKSIDTSLLFDSDEESAQSDGRDSDSNSGTERNHILGIEDDFLLVLMKLRLRRTNHYMYIESFRSNSFKYIYYVAQRFVHPPWCSQSVAPKEGNIG